VTKIRVSLRVCEWFIDVLCLCADVATNVVTLLLELGAAGVKSADVRRLYNLRFGHDFSEAAKRRPIAQVMSEIPGVHCGTRDSQPWYCIGHGAPARARTPLPPGSMDGVFTRPHSTTILCSTLLFSTLLHSTPLYSTPLHSTPLYSTLSTLLYLLDSTRLDSTRLDSTRLDSTRLYSTLLFSTPLHSTSKLNLPSLRYCTPLSPRVCPCSGPG
jgi:hypothetical protein